MKQIIKSTVILLVIIFVLTLPYFVFAQEASLDDAMTALRDSAGFAEADETTLSAIIGRVVSAFLSLLGVIFIGLMLYGGYNWMTASGNEQKIDKAKSTLLRATIGLIIVVGSYAIWEFVLINFILG